MPQTVLIVDDDPVHRRLMQGICERAGYFVTTQPDGQGAIDLLRGSEGAGIGVVLLDLMMPNLSGMETLEEIKRIRADLPVIVLTAKGSIGTVVEAMQAGASDFFVKPASPERIVISLKQVTDVKTLRNEVQRLERKQTGTMGFGDIIGDSPALKACARMGERAAASNIPILITGESGTGKEMMARAIQGASDRSGKPFVTVNCGALPENLVESILFGHEKGAFTGAVSKHAGKFQEADGGTIFLDEVGELPLEAQVKLLRVLQEGEVDPVGSKKPVKVDVRVISATNRNLEDEVRAGRFREDLFYRLSVFPIEVPALRERREDIPALITHFIDRYNASEGRSVRGVQHHVLDVLQKQDWPGNIRQLENTIYRAVILSEGPWLSASDFPLLASVFTAEGIEDCPPREQMEDTDTAQSADGDTADPRDDAADMFTETDPDEGDYTLSEDVRLLDLSEIERDLIAMAIEKYDGQMSEVARRLGIGRSTLYRKVQEQGLEVKRAS